jgi:nicotinamidase-related amidase
VRGNGDANERVTSRDGEHNEAGPDALNLIFAADSEIYRSRGFMRRIGFGRRPALIKAEALKAGTEVVAIDERVAPHGDEQLIIKKRASAFHGTYLAGFLRAHDVDTVLLAGVTMAGCVRHTAEDAIAEGFRTIVVRKCVGDRVPSASSETCSTSTRSSETSSRSTRVLAYLDGLPVRD